MILAVPKEVKEQEYRVGLTPEALGPLLRSGHRVLVEKGAGEGSGFPDEAYRRAGAEIMEERRRLYGEADLIVKVKEPQPSEYDLFQNGQTLVAFLHLAANRPLTLALQERGVTAIAYETVLSAQGGLPLLKPMSEIAGRMSVLMGAYYLQKAQGGSGVLFPGASDAPPARVVVLGSGTVGTEASMIALNLEAEVTLFYRKGDRTPEVGPDKAGRFSLQEMVPEKIGQCVSEADLVIGAVLIQGARAPRLVGRKDIASMRKGSVVVDVSIDQGGCFETSRPTTHSDPVFSESGVLHYCVANMPGAYPRTATLAMVSRSAPYIQEMASRGPIRACREDPLLGAGLNVYEGSIRHQAVAEAHGLEYKKF